MGKHWTAPGGWEVELIRLNGQPCFRVRHHGVLEGYCRNMAELKRLLQRAGVNLSDLTPDPDHDPAPDHDRDQGTDP